MIKKTKIMNFFDQVRQEAFKIVWPNRKEVFSFSSLILIVIFISSLFFLLVDTLMHNLVQLILNF